MQMVEEWVGEVNTVCVRQGFQRCNDKSSSGKDEQLLLRLCYGYTVWRGCRKGGMSRGMVVSWEVIPGASEHLPWTRDSCCYVDTVGGVETMGTSG